MSSSVADVCSSSRDGGGSGNISSGSGGVNSGDWICGDVTCHHSNFARRKQCNKCHRDRSQERSSSVGSSGSNKKKLGTEIGKAAAEKSRGLFSAEDWQCNKCANVNWARRNTCNMCNAPKFCDNEERTGFGGGYNDRGVVEYKEREESDSEYDEFGRLKKKRNHSFNQDDRPEMVKHIKEKMIEEEEDDEEEDGDDDDLAKYNLFSDDEDAIPASKESPKNSISNSLNKHDKSPMNRRSRSKKRSDVRRRQSRSSSSGGSSSSSSTNSSSTSTSSSSSSSSSSSRSSLPDNAISRTLGSIHKRTYTNSRSRSRSPKKFEAKKQRSPSKDTENKKRSHNILKPSAVKTEERRTSYTSNSRSKSRSSNHSSRSPSSKRNRSRNSKSSGKLSRSPANSNRKRSTRSRSLTPKRRR